MKHRPFNLKICAMAALIAGFGGATVADDQNITTFTPEQLAAQDADAERSAALQAIAADRTGTIDGLVAVWEPTAAEMGMDIEKWKTRFIPALESATDQQLLDIQSATSYDAVRAILLGQDISLSLDGIVGMEALGSLTSDLVFTPVVPCRFFDTRPSQGATGIYAGPFGGDPGHQVDYQTWGESAAQGGGASSCPAPATNMVAMAANFTVVPYGKGHIRVWPYLQPEPNASFLNYNSPVNSNLANAGIVQTCYLCSNEISVSTWYGTADSLGDVMGYFYPAPIPANSVGMNELDSADLNSGYSVIFTTLVSGANYATGPSFTANATGKCLVSTTGQIYKDLTDTYDGVFLRTARKVGAATPVDDFTYGQYFSAISGEYYTHTVSAFAVWDVTGGTTYEFGCYANGGGDLIGESLSCRTSWMCF